MIEAGIVSLLGQHGLISALSPCCRCGLLGDRQATGEGRDYIILIYFLLIDLLIEFQPALWHKVGGDDVVCNYYAPCTRWAVRRARPMFILFMSLCLLFNVA